MAITGNGINDAPALATTDIGWQRENAAPGTRDRTFALIALSTGVVTAFAVDVLSLGAQGQVIGGDLTGIGFLGAGVILRLGTGQVRGLTTASIWDVSGLSVLIGEGHSHVAILLAALALINLMWRKCPRSPA